MEIMVEISQQVWYAVSQGREAFSDGVYWFVYSLTSNKFIKSIWKGRNFLKDILVYGVLVVVTFFLLKKL